MMRTTILAALFAAGCGGMSADDSRALDAMRSAVTAHGGSVTAAPDTATTARVESDYAASWSTGGAMSTSMSTMMGGSSMCAAASACMQKMHDEVADHEARMAGNGDRGACVAEEGRHQAAMGSLMDCMSSAMSTQGGMMGH